MRIVVSLNGDRWGGDRHEGIQPLKESPPKSLLKPRGENLAKHQKKSQNTNTEPGGRWGRPPTKKKQSLEQSNQNDLVTHYLSDVQTPEPTFQNHHSTHLKSDTSSQKITPLSTHVQTPKTTTAAHSQIPQNTKNPIPEIPGQGSLLQYGSPLELPQNFELIINHELSKVHYLSSTKIRTGT